MKATRWLAGAVVLGVALAGCGDDDDESAGGGTSFADVVQASIAAENAQDTEAFLALWTDDGLASYDVGTREEIESGEANIGLDQLNIVDVGEPEIDGQTASMYVDVSVGTEELFVTPLFRVELEGVKAGDGWKIDGFEFLGSPPPGPDAEVVDVTATEYEFGLEPETVPAGEVAFTFVNEGAEPHEITLFKAPDGVSVDEAKSAVEHVDGGELDNVPDGYEVAHIGFAEPGQPAVDITFAEPLDPGTYVFACYIPQGSEGDEGEGDGVPHISLGMVSLLTIE